MTNFTIFPRRLLRHVLKTLTVLFILKNDIEIIAVIGEVGSDTCKDALYEIFSKRGKVIKNNVPFQKDYELPLMVTGSKIFPSNGFLLLYAMARLAIRLVIGKKVSYTAIVEITTTDAGIGKYWSQIMKPQFLVLLNTHVGTHNIPLLFINVTPKKHVLIVNKDNAQINALIMGDKATKYFFGANLKSDLTYEIHNERTVFHFHQDTIDLRNTLPDVAIMPIAGAILTGIAKGYSFHNCIAALETFQVQSSKVQSKLYQYYE